MWALFGVFITAAILGDALNYAIGNYAGAESYQCSFSLRFMHPKPVSVLKLH